MDNLADFFLIKNFILRKSKNKYFQNKEDVQEIIQIKDLLIRDLRDPARFVVKNKSSGEENYIIVSEFGKKYVLIPPTLKKRKKSYLNKLNLCPRK